MENSITEPKNAEMRPRRLTPQQVRNRQVLLNKVRKFWVEGILESSLHNQVLIKLGLVEHTNTTVSSWSIELEAAGMAQKPLSKGTRGITIFDKLGEGKILLILGESGSGKTTTLLELTRDLLNRAEQSLAHPIPVVLNLSSWARKQQTIPDWVVEQLNTQYQVHKLIGQEWVKQQELLLLLDGLDEVKTHERDSCVAALHDFQQNYAQKTVVCSRIQDYSVLFNRLNIEKAIYLKSLTPEQVNHYLDNINADLTGLRTLISTNRALKELVQSPLMLNMMIIAYQGVAVADLPQTEVVGKWRKQLFDAYIKRMFRHPTHFNKVKQRYSAVHTKRWLTWLAQRLVNESPTVFFIEEMQPNWLQGKKKKKLYLIGSFLIAWLIYLLSILLISGLGIGLITAMYMGLVDLSIALNFGLITGLSFGLITGLITICGKPKIKTVETLDWLWGGATTGLEQGWIGNLIAGLVGSVLCGMIPIVFSDHELIFGIIVGLIYLFYYGFNTGLIAGLISELIFRLSGGIQGSNKAIKIIPNQGIYKTAKNAAIMGLVIWLIIWLVCGIIPGLFFWSGDALTYELIVRLFFGLIVGLIGGLIAAVVNGGKACIRHFTLRLILYRKGCIPWNYARFLDYASDRIFLRKVGGGYVFIHHLLLEHFARMKL